MQIQIPAGKNSFLSLILICLCLPVSFAQTKSAKAKKPNILIIYVDDLGYGDVSCYGATGFKTANVDALAKGGLRFTDAHCSASTCTPSRFSLLTGSYAFRNNAAILPGDAPLIINTKQQTLPGMLQKAGYTTGVIGKWHLGLGNGKPNWNDSISPGPLEIGFDYSFLIPATPDRVPTVYVENHHVVKADDSDPIAVNYDQPIGNDPIGLTHPQLLKMKADSQHSGTIVNGISRIGYMSGGHRAYWKDEDFATVLTARAKSFIQTNKNKPFFLYFALPDIHVPRAPNARFVGATKLGPRGDDIIQMDWITGQMLQTLKQLHLDKNTLIIFSSDNGPVLDDGYADQAVSRLGKHQPAGPYTGGKYSAYEGGTRVPLITYWPGVINPGVSNALLNQADLFASLAKLTATPITANTTAPDSFDMLPVLMGTSRKGHQQMIEEAFTMAIRVGNWKYIAPATKRPPVWLANKTVPTGLQNTPQLYNLTTDPAERHNLATQYPDKAKAMANALALMMAKPTRPGIK